IPISRKRRSGSFGRRAMPPTSTFQSPGARRGFLLSFDSRACPCGSATGRANREETQALRKRGREHAPGPPGWLRHDHCFKLKLVVARTIPLYETVVCQVPVGHAVIVFRLKMYCPASASYLQAVEPAA